MVLIIGVLIIALGLLSGGALVLASFGVLGADPGFTLWVTFPLLCLFGFTLIATQAKLAVVRMVSLGAAAILLLLAVASIAGLVLGAANLVHIPGRSAPLWFVFVVGATLGSVGAASFGRATAEA